MDKAKEQEIVRVFNEHAGTSHEAAIAAVYTRGYEEGTAAAKAPPPPPASVGVNFGPGVKQGPVEPEPTKDA